MAQAALLVLVSVGLALARADVVRVDRAGQFEVDEVAFGSRRAAVNAPGVYGSVTDPAVNEVIVVRALDVRCDVDLLTRANTSAGVFILLPEDMSAIHNDRSVQQRLIALERALASRAVDLPVYFATEGPQLNGIVERLINNEQKGKDRYQFVVHGDGTDGTASTTSLSSVVGWLEGQSGKDVVAIVAGWDALYAAGVPAAPPSDSPATDASFLLEATRIFARLYKDNAADSSLLFALVGGNPFGKSGAQHWVSTLDAVTLENIRLVVYIDRIAADIDGPLYVHSDASTTPDVDRFVRQLVDAGKVAGVVVEPRRHKADAASMRPHEIFHRAHLPAVAISGRADGGASDADPAITSVFAAPASFAALARGRARAVCEGVAAFVLGAAYPLGSLTLADPQPIDDWARYLGRVAVRPGTAARTIRDQLAKRLSNVQILRFALDPRYRIFGYSDADDLSFATLHVHPLRSFAFAVIATVSIASVGLLLFMAFSNMT